LDVVRATITKLLQKILLRAN